MTGAAAATLLAERLRTLIERQVWESPAGSLHLTISFGVAAWPSPVITLPEQLLICADQALYQAKAQGRNQVAVFAPSGTTSL